MIIPILNHSLLLTTWDEHPLLPASCPVNIFVTTIIIFQLNASRQFNFSLPNNNKGGVACNLFVDTRWRHAEDSSDMMMIIMGDSSSARGFVVLSLAENVVSLFAFWTCVVYTTTSIDWRSWTLSLDNGHCFTEQHVHIVIKDCGRQRVDGHHRHHHHW